MKQLISGNELVCQSFFLWKFCARRSEFWVAAEFRGRQFVSRGERNRNVGGVKRLGATRNSQWWDAVGRNLQQEELGRDTYLRLEGHRDDYQPTRVSRYANATSGNETPSRPQEGGGDQQLRPLCRARSSGEREVTGRVFHTFWPADMAGGVWV